MRGDPGWEWWAVEWTCLPSRTAVDEEMRHYKQRHSCLACLRVLFDLLGGDAEAEAEAEAEVPAIPVTPDTTKAPPV